MTLSEAFRDQAQSCQRLDSPFMCQLFNLLADHWPVGSRLDKSLSAFEGDIGPSGASLPLRIGGGLHALVLTRQAPELAELYPPNAVPDALLLPALRRVLRTHENFLIEWIKSPPQTNEVRRSAALIAGAHVAHARFGLPIVLSELGASAGLNLMWDRYALRISDTVLGPSDPVIALAPDWVGPLPPRESPVIAERAGADLNPLDPKSPEDELRLCAYLWADQPERIARTRAAAAVTEARIVRADAIDWLAARLTKRHEGHLHLIQHTVAWQYFHEELQVRGRDMILEAGEQATVDRPLAWLSMESDGDRSGAAGAALTLRLWPGNETLYLGRADFHGRWVNWSGAA